MHINISRMCEKSKGSKCPTDSNNVVVCGIQIGQNMPIISILFTTDRKSQCEKGLKVQADCVVVYVYIYVLCVFSFFMSD